MSSEDDVPLFERCGNTSFWRPKGQTNDDLDVTFVDPVSIVVIKSSPEPKEELLVLVARGWFEESYSGLFEELHAALPTDESVALIIWLRTIIETLPKIGKDAIVRQFSKMLPESQRLIISGIIHWLTKIPRGWKADKKIIPADVKRLWTLLNSAGIHEC